MGQLGLAVLLSLGLLWLLNASSMDDTKDILAVGHAVNAVKVAEIMLKKMDMNKDSIPDVSSDRMNEMRATFNDSQQGYEYYHEEIAFDYVSLIGHSPANSSDVVKFETGARIRTNHFDGAKLVCYVRHAPSSAQRVQISVKDELGFDIAVVNVTAPNAHVKRYTISLGKRALARAIEESADEAFLSLRVSVRAVGVASTDLLVVPGRLGYQPHMGIVLELKYSKKRAHQSGRIRRNAHGAVLRGQCVPGQTTCCPHVQVFDWEELGFTHIIAPPKFHSVICRGTCEDHDQMDLKHTRNRQTIMGHRKPCCHPLRFEHQRVIWVNKKMEIEQRDIPNFYATRCGCD